MLSQAAGAIIPALPTVPPTPNEPYSGKEITTSVRAALQHALDTYAPGETHLQLRPSADLSRSDTRSFGLTHAKELSRINSSAEGAPGIPLTPPPPGSNFPPPAPSHTLNAPIAPGLPTPTPAYPSPPLSGSPPVATRPYPDAQSPPLNPASLNQAPAPIPMPASATSATSPVDPASSGSGAGAPVVAPDSADAPHMMPTVTPTVAETGVPKAAGPEGPGPASGSLRELRRPSEPSSSPVVGKYGELPGYEGGAGPSAGGGKEKEKGEKWESAEEEKKRLEREERERVLGEGAGSKADEAGGHDLPPYSEF